MNRKQRRIKQRNARRERIKAKRKESTEERVPLEMEAPESNHATVMVLNEPEWTPLKDTGRRRDGCPIWENSRYVVAVYGPDRNTVPEGFPKVVHLSFKHVHNVAITDFRDMQQIKNEIVGKESMAIQVFPPESHLVDGANQYHLWCFVPASWPKVTDECVWPWLPIGFRDGRVVSEAAPPGGRQRSFDSHVAPTEEDSQIIADLQEEIQQRLDEMSKTGRY